MPGKHKAIFIQPPITLADRMSALGFKDADLSEADKAIDRMAIDFVHRLPNELQRIENALTALKEKPDDNARRTALFRMVHDLKGQAGTFDYVLITVVGNDLCRFLEKPIPMLPRCLKVAELHLEAMQRIAQDKITGDGEELGLRLVSTLHRMTQKVLLQD